MNKKLINSIKFLIFFGLGIFLFWYLYRNQDLGKIMDELKHVNYWWIIFSLVLGVLSHVSRAVRWNMLINTLGYHPRTINSFFSVMISYLANLAIPRLGEITRPTIVRKYEGIPYPSSFGTIVLERVIDVIMLLILTGIVLITQLDVILKFLKSNPKIGDKFSNFDFSGNSLLVFAGVLLILFVVSLVFRRKFRQTPVYRKVVDIISRFMAGVKTIRNLKRFHVFILHTLFIWFMYYMMLYVSFFAFEFTSHLSMMAGLTLFVMGSYGMVAPVQGGIGAWHFMIMGTLLLFKVEDSNSAAFALLVHGSQTLMIIVFGSISLIALPIVNKKQIK